MKKLLAILAFLSINLTEAQSVFEYTKESSVGFKVYLEPENKLTKISNIKDFNSDTPEALVRSYFFATSNEILSTLYLDRSKFTEKAESHFEKMENTDSEDIYVQLLHRTTGNFEGDEMAYVMFIARIKGVEFSFPTVLSLIRKGDKWFIHKRPNQRKLTEALMMFKPCVTSNLVEGESEDQDVTELILKTRNEDGNLDFIKLFDALVSINEDENLATKLTMAQNMDCSDLSFREEVTGKSNFTGIFQKAGIKSYREQDAQIISLIEKKNDSVVFTSRLDFEFSGKKYELVRYDRIKENGQIKKESIRMDGNANPEKPAEEFIFLFENLKTQIFFDLTPSMNKNEFMDTALYKETRGVYDVLSISKLYGLFSKRKELFSEYME